MNNTESRTTFIFNLTWAEQLAELDDATRLRFMDAIIAYAKDGTMPKMSALEKALFIGIQADIDLNNEKFEAIRQKRSEAGKKGGLKSGTERSKTKQSQANEANASFVKQNEAKPSKTKQSQANEAEYENEYENEIKENDVVVKESSDDVDVINKEIALLKTQEIWLSDLERLHRVDKSNLIRYLDLFAIHCRAEGKKRHNKLSDAQSHFNGWLRIKLEQDGKQQQHNRRGRNRLTTDDKDYTSSF